MSVSKSELKCYEYINSINDILSIGEISLYNLDKFRTIIHDELCEIFGLTKDQTLDITNNIDLESHNPSQDLYLNLLELSRNVKEELQRYSM